MVQQPVVEGYVDIRTHFSRAFLVRAGGFVRDRRKKRFPEENIDNARDFADESILDYKFIRQRRGRGAPPVCVRWEAEGNCGHFLGIVRGLMPN